MKPILITTFAIQKYFPELTTYSFRIVYEVNHINYPEHDRMLHDIFNLLKYLRESGCKVPLLLYSNMEIERTDLMLMN